MKKFLIYKQKVMPIIYRMEKIHVIYQNTYHVTLRKFKHLICGK